MQDTNTVYLVWFDHRLKDWFACNPSELAPQAKALLVKEGVQVVPVRAGGLKEAIAKRKNWEESCIVH